MTEPISKHLPSPSLPAPSIAESALRPTVPQPKTRKPPPRVRDAIHAYVSGRAKTKTAAAKMAGISREYFERSLSLPHVAEYLRARALREITTSAGRGAARLIELMESSSGKTALDAIKHALGIAGIKPAADASVSVNVGIEVRAGYVIDLSERDEPPVKIVGGQVDAKPEPIAGIGPGGKPAE